MIHKEYGIIFQSHILLIRRYQSGQRRDVIIAYAINGKPLVHGEDDAGFDGNNGFGPLQLVAENQIFMWVKHVAAVKIE